MDKAVICSFINLLKERFEHASPTKEDAVRYTYYLALMQHNAAKHYNVVMEASVKELGSQEVDTWIKGEEPGHDIFIEFKYDRDRESRINSTKRAADLFNDFFKLARIPVGRGRRYVVYLCDERMRPYWKNRNGFEKVMNMQVRDRMELDKDFVQARRKTFIKAIKGFNRCSVRLIHPHEDKAWDLRIFEVL